MDWIWIALIASICGIAYIVYLTWSVLKLDTGTQRMEELSKFIQVGANAYLKRQNITISFFIAGISIVLFFILGFQIAVGFIIGASLSLLAAYIGMNVSTRANVRTTNAARTNPGRAMTVAFRGGAVMGLSVVSFSILGLTILFLLFDRTPSLIVGFGFGASLAALFAQLGGGIYTKAADVGADIVGKIEAEIPEDDPRNPAVIADLVGDNVGDCAGRGADLFESFSDNIIGAMILGFAFQFAFGHNAILFPLVAEAIGIFGTIIGISIVKGERNSNPIFRLNMGFLVSGIICAIGFYFLTIELLGNVLIFFAALSGLAASLFVAIIIQYYTGSGKRPVKEIASASQTGPAINIQTGLAIGLESSIWPVLVVSGVVLFSYWLTGTPDDPWQGVYGIAAATLGILSATGIIMASDTFGPIADNAGGIAEMAGLEAEVRQSADVLDAVGNTTKALTKGYAMACATLSAVVLFLAYLQEWQQEIGAGDLSWPVVNIADPVVLVGIFLGACLPFIFSALALRAVGRTAFQMVEEVRRQFKEIEGLMEGKTTPDYSRGVDISTRNALKEMILPTVISVLAPIIIGLTLKLEALGAFIISTTITGALLAIFMINSGGAWDNAKKYIETGEFGGKYSDAHKASVVGDTVGDPFKDTAGPSLHILVKLVNIVSLTFIPLFLLFA
ncbi:MAG: sodium-translocating pyrophosphatase [Promethearchaeota archaeon]